MLGPQFNPEALSRQVKDDGGFSVNPQTGATPGNGYMVSYHGDEAVVPGHPSPTAIEGFATQHQNHWSQPDNFMGAWHDDGETYLDVSANIPDRATANRRGAEEAQRAIYSTRSGGAPKVKHAESINRKGTVFESLSPQEHKEVTRGNQEYARSTTERRRTVEKWNAAHDPAPSPSKWTQPSL